MAQLRQNPLDPSILESLRKHCENTGDPSTWAEALEHHARAASAADADPIELGRLHFELGNLYRDQLGRSDRAITHYRAAIDHDAAQRAAIAAARAIFAEAGKWDQVAKLLAREADSLPEGHKKTALLKEQVQVLRDRVGDAASAAEVLREAVASAPTELALQHELATLLLDQADASTDRARATALRKEAADILLEMAKRVSDDYAFAYVEAALDAVPDHEPSLRLLQTVAPRMGRADSVPARWVASLQFAPDGPLAREIRLKLAIAYRTAGQIEDAWLCLKPLVDRGDAEARNLAEGIAPKSQPPAARVSERPVTRAPAPQPAPSSSLFDLEDQDLLVDEKTGASQDLSSELSELQAESTTRASSPLSDLSTLAARDNSDDKTLVEDPDDLDEPELDAEPEARAAVAEADLADVADDFDDGEEAEELTGSGLEEVPAGLREASSEQELSADEAEPSEDEEELSASGLQAVTADGEIVEDGALEAGGADDDAQEADELDVADQEAEEQETAAQLSDDDELESGAYQIQGEDSRATPAQLTGETDRAPPPPAEEELAATPAGGLANLFASAPGASVDDGPDTDPDGEAAPAPQRSAGKPDAAHEEHALAAELAHALQPAQNAESPLDAEEADLPEESTQPRGDLATARETSRPKPMAKLSGQTTAARERPTIQEEVSQEPEDELTVLRRELKKKIRFRDRRGAAELAERMLGMGLLEPDAISALEDHYRMTRDFRRMRDLAMRLAADVEIPVEARLSRLREAAMLSESKLGDVDGTALAWREVLALLPTDDEANNKLRRLLTRLSRWDELAQLLEQRAQAEGDAHDRARRYRELATLHRDKRKSAVDAIAALEQARQLDPGVASDSALLCDLYVAAGRHADAAAMYESRIAETEEPVERIPLLVTLADLYENELGNLEAAYASAEALLHIAPRHLASLDRQLRIDERLSRWDQVIRVLEAKLLLSDAPARAKLHAHIGQVAFSKLNDANRAADAYASALDITPDDRALLDSANPAFESAGRRAELTESIAAAAQHARDANKRFDLYALVAERHEADGDLTHAISAREAQLAVRRDPSTLAALVSLLRRTDRATDLVRRLDELARAQDPKAARELRLERAAVLAEQLSNLEAAKSELLRVLDELSPDDTHVLEMLIDLCRRSDDVARRTEAQERLVRLTPSIEGKVDLVTDLVETFEKIADLDGAIRVLRGWIGFEPGNPQPHLRIAPLLEKSGKREELRATYDSLATLAMGEDESAEYLLRAARVALDLADYEGAWNRLVPRVVDASDAAAEALLKEVAVKGARAEALSELYVGLAQRDEAAGAGHKRWLDAARTYETLVGAHDKALEAVLRAFAKDLDSRELLAEAERLTELANAWPRLGKVYDALVRRAETAEGRIAVLMRHAALLEHNAGDAASALARTTLAFQLDPTREDVFGDAVRLATAQDEHEQLIALFERRSQANLELPARLTALLSACRTAYAALEDVPRATSYLARAVAFAASDAALLDNIENSVAQLDRENPAPHGRGLLHALSEVYARAATEADRTPELCALLWTRASRLLEEALSDLPGAYQALERASARKAHDEALLDSLVELAARANKQQALAEHLSERAESAMDSASASAALWRLGALYEDGLNSQSLAADTYAQLVKLNPRDVAAYGRLRRALSAGGRHKELLLAIERELSLSPDPHVRVQLLKEAAVVWERDLGNRFEALDTWRKVLNLEPDHEEAMTAVARLKARPKLDESSLLDDDLVVRPEDLRPSLAPDTADETADVQAGSAADSVDEPSPGHEEPAPEEPLARHVLTAQAEPAGEPVAPDEPVAQAELAAAEPTLQTAAEATHTEDDKQTPDSSEQDEAEPATSEQDEAEAQAEHSESAQQLEPRGEPTEMSEASEASEPETARDALETAAQRLDQERVTPVSETASDDERVSGVSDQTPVAGAALLASLANKVAALQDEGEEEGRVSELEQATLAAAHAASLQSQPEAARHPESGDHAVDRTQELATTELLEDGPFDPDATMDIDAFEVEAHEEEVAAGPNDLSSLSSLVDRLPAGSAPRGPAGSRVPPPPPGRRPSAPPPPPAGRSVPPPPATGTLNGLPKGQGSVRPPPPPRRS